MGTGFINPAGLWVWNLQVQVQDETSSLAQDEHPLHGNHNPKRHLGTQTMYCTIDLDDFDAKKSKERHSDQWQLTTCLCTRPSSLKNESIHSMLN
jgi:hypothetical protein